MRVHAAPDQDPVYEGSCVEFFYAHGCNYRNFEFNCLGVYLSATGPDQHNRVRLQQQELGRIVRIPSLCKDNLPAEGKLGDWELTVGIPLSILAIKAGCMFFGNFYRCGAKTGFYIQLNRLGRLSMDVQCQSRSKLCHFIHL